MSTLEASDARMHQLDVIRGALQRLGIEPLQIEELSKAIEDVASGAEVLIAALDQDLTPNQMAKALKMSRTHLYKLLDDGVIASYRVGRDRRIPAAEFIRFARSRELAKQTLAETFALQDSQRNKLISSIANVEPELASQLGF